MGATAEERLAKRRINELEERLKKLQKEVRELKSEKKHAGHLRKQLARVAGTEAICKEILDEAEATELERIERESAAAKRKKENEYKCKNAECLASQGFYGQVGCDTIEVGTRLIVICRECGGRYSVVS